MTGLDPVRCSLSECKIDPAPSRHIISVECPDCGRHVRAVDWSAGGPRYAPHNELRPVYPSLGDALARFNGAA